MISRIIVAVLLLFPQFVYALNVDGREAGNKTTGQAEIWHDAHNDLSLKEVISIYQRGEFKPLTSAGSTGLERGAFWSHFALRNITDKPLTLDIEYVDHQLIELEAYQRLMATDDYNQIASMALSDPFDSRPVPHNRFVFEVTIEPQQVAELFVKLSSHQAGYVFPSMRIWTPENLRKANNVETSIVMFLFGGIFLMSIVSLVGAAATRDRTFTYYSIYALSKIVCWGTVLGYTHQYFIKEHYNWSYLTVSAALGVLCGTLFSRVFLQTRKYTPKIDYILIFMVANAAFVIVCALLGFKSLAVALITLALLLYPMLSVAGVVRWHQGSTDAAVFAVAWTLLVCSIVWQALRDLGFVEHNFINYYWPAVASFIEMIGIMAAMGIKVRRLRVEKEAAEHRYMSQLERSKAVLEVQVQRRTVELEEAKKAAELEARTDPLTGVFNRRSFFAESSKCLNLALHKHQPLSLLMFDIDHFKSINDTYGHAMGDEALRQFSKIIANNLREEDVWGRIGGEEFALVLYEDKEGTLQTAHRLRQEIGGMNIDTPVGELRLTASIGIAYLEQEKNIEALLNKADKALYEAKHSGRDCIIESSLSESDDAVKNQSHKRVSK